jgi:type IV pilus assembly protein PilM
MAKTEAVWGIDIGNSALKAVRCRLDSEPNQVVAEAFDYIEYPQILTQPGAEAEQLVSDALTQFQTRNSVRGDRVAICVSGQSGLARFIKLPPVEAKRIPDIVKYEARQQIPFDLNDVIWDYQQIAGGMEVEGFVLEAEVGIFAMKRDQVFRSLQPLSAAGLDIDFVQLAPLALYNFLAFDQLADLPSPDEYDPEDPPPSYIILCMGTDATDLVVTNGFRVWQRSIPLGGNHFTKALTKELKLTFAKAEHVKRNASAAEDPKAVYQAMRPVFNDLLTEIQRSITYFTSIDRSAKISKIVPLGNAMKLPGLRRYLGQNLGYEVVRLKSFRGLVGPEVVNAPAFQENLLAFAPSYGLALQALGKSLLRTNLLPKELLKDRLIREKKPWAVAAAAALLLACTISFVGYSRAWGTIGGSDFRKAEEEVQSVISDSQSYKSDEQSAKGQFTATDEIGKHLVGGVEGRLRWLELLKAISTCLPQDPPDRRPEDISQRNELHVTSLECVHLEKLEDWFAFRQKSYTPPGGAAAAPAAAPAPAPAPAAAGAPAPAAPGQGPTGPGWVIQLKGYHYHNVTSTSGPRGPQFLQGAQFVKDTLIKGLEGLDMPVQLPDPDQQGQMAYVPMKDLGISFPVLIDPGRIFPDQVMNPNAETARGMPGAMGMPGYTGSSEEDEGGYRGGYPGRGPGGMGRAKTEDEEDPIIDLMRFNFQVEFAWQPRLSSERRQAGQLAEQQSEAQP